MPDPRLLDQGSVLELELEGRPTRFHALWLRDNARDPATRDAGNGQRLITLLDIAADVRIDQAEWDEATLNLRFEPEGRWIGFDRDWLRSHVYDDRPIRDAGWTDETIERWDAAAAAAVPVEHYDALLSDPQRLLGWLATLCRYGFARLTGAPPTQGVAEGVAGLFGFIRETNYGRTFDVRSEVAPSNLAYTNLGLQAHTDNPYRDPVPGLQILTCIANDVEGGASLLVDGFKIVERLQTEMPRGFELLSSRCARFDYAGANGVRLRSKRPLIELGCDGELIALRFNSRSAAAFTDIPFDEMADYYAAYRRMAELVEDERFAFRFRLAPVDLFVVDNMRVLHARSAFLDHGDRWLQGCYVDKDGMLSTLAGLQDRFDGIGA